MSNVSKKKPYILHLLRQYRAFVLLFAVILLVSHPLILFFQKRSELMSQSYYTGMYFPPFSLAALTIAVIGLCIVMPFIVLGFIYNKSSMDAYFSMPIKRVTLFLKHLGFGWLMILVPMLVSLVLGFVIYQKMSIPIVLASSPYSFLLLLKQAGLLSIGSLIMIMPSTLAILCTTNLFNGMIYAVVLNVFPYLIRSVWNLFAQNFLGYTRLERVGTERELGWLEFHSLYIEAFHGTEGVANVIEILLWFVVAVALLVLVCRLFATHHVERTNSNYMVKGFYPVVITSFGIIALVGVLGASRETSRFRWDVFTEEMFIYTFAVGFIVYFVVQIVRRQGLPKILPVILSYVAIFAAASILCWTLSGTVRDNRGRQVLSSNQVAKARLISAAATYDYVEGSSKKYIYYEPWDMTSLWVEQEFRSKEEIEQVLTLQQNLITYWIDSEQTKGEAMEFYAYSNVPSVQIIYEDAEGNVLQARLYYITTEPEMELATELLGRAPYKPDAYSDFKPESP